MNKKLYEKLEYIDKKAGKTSADLEFLIKNSENSDSEIRDYEFSDEDIKIFNKI